MPFYIVRHLAGQLEELSCLIQLEDENAAMYFNIIHGPKTRRHFTTAKNGRPCEDYLLIARDAKAPGPAEERQITLFDVSVRSGSS